MTHKKKYSFEDLSKESRHLYDVINKAGEESDLSCVLVGAAFLDDVLRTILYHSLRRSETTDKLLRSGVGVIGNLQTRADLTYSLELINKVQYQDLCIISQIRNHFAHNHWSIDFKDAQVKDLCNKLKQWRIVDVEPLGVDDKMTDEIMRIVSKNKYTFTVIFLFNRLVMLGLSLDKQKS